MMDQHEHNNLFRLQTELIDRKVEMAAVNAMDQVFERMDALFNKHRKETIQIIDNLRIDMNKKFSIFENKLTQLDHKISKVDIKVDHLGRQVNQLEHKVNQLEIKVDQLDSKVTQIDDRLRNAEHRMVAVETKLGIVNERQKELRNRFFDYTFKAGWLALGIIITYTLLHVQILSKI